MTRYTTYYIQYKIIKLINNSKIFKYIELLDSSWQCICNVTLAEIWGGTIPSKFSEISLIQNKMML